LEDPLKFSVPSISNDNCFNNAGVTRTIKVFNITKPARDPRQVERNPDQHSRDRGVSLLTKRLILLFSFLCSTPAWGAIASVSASQTICSQTSASAGTACTLAAPTTAGDTVIAGITWSNTSASIKTVVGNVGSSYFFPYAQVCGAGSCSAILICRNCAALTAVTPNFTQSTLYNLSTEEYSGVAAIGITGTATGTSTAPGITITSGDPNDWLVAVTSSPGNAGIPAAGTGNLRSAVNTGSSGSDVAGAACDNTVAAAGSLSCSVAITSGAWSAVGVELRTTFLTTYIWPDCDSTHPCVIHGYRSSHLAGQPDEADHQPSKRQDSHVDFG
jgi:hypothetical protein